MGNNHSGHLGVTQPPPPWTQSLPRDAHRNKKYGAVNQGTKVLPERIPGQRLKATENGRNLQVQGTISPKKIIEISHHPPSYGPPFANHHSSMTALNNNSQHNLPVSFFPPTSNSITDLRFNSPPSKSFTSEPDLRDASPLTKRSVSAQPPHMLVCDNASKGKIKSKKRNKAPMPPPLKTSISFPLECRMQSGPSPCSAEVWSTTSSPTPRNMKSKPRKIGLFKKKSESRMAKYSCEEGLSCKFEQADNIHRSNERSITPVPLRNSSKKDLKERARSLDNLQHDLKKSSPKELASSMHSLKIIGSIPPENGRKWYDIDNQNIRHNDATDSRRCSTLERESRSKSKDKSLTRVCSTLDRESKSHKRMSAVERRTYEKQLEERKLAMRISMPETESMAREKTPYKIIQNYRRSLSSCSSYQEPVQEEPKDEWDKAEEEWLQRKKKSEDLQSEIIKAAKGLRKTSSPPNKTYNQDELITMKPTECEKSKKVSEEDDAPKTFFFGMEPSSLEPKASCNSNSALLKLNDVDDIKIIGNTVEYSRHSLKPKEKRKVPEKESWNKSLDYRKRNREKEKDPEDGFELPEDDRKLDRKMDKFVATIERTKSKRIPSPEELSNSITRKGDGGYHSRQNSGSFHLDTEGSDEDNVIRMNLRPILPRRQLELPRFCPNAAWKSLGAENSARQKEVFNDVQEHEDIFGVNEDIIHRSTRPTAPPRGTGEKSADSGISGDAGSPGPIQEFEPLTPEKLKSSSGPLAVSSPVASARLELKKTWTPAQDLDDNSFEEAGDHRKSSQEHQVTPLPKLTSRSNMFNNSYIDREEEVEFSKGYKDKEIQKPYQPRYFDENVLTHEAKNVVLNHALSKSFQETTYKGKEENQENINDDIMKEDNWRENWSLSRSIPNSLNTCDEPDCASNSSRPVRTKSESRMCVGNNEGEKISKAITPSYLQRGTNGHIMYLPEYKSYKYNNETENDTQNDNYNKQTIQDLTEDDLAFHENIKHNLHGNDEVIQRSGGKKGKKFTYQSTVRILEKKIIEKQLTKEAEEKERRRLNEKEAMLKVEQEFQKKREREKKRLKKQLKLYQDEQREDIKMEHHSSSSEEVKAQSPHSYSSHEISPQILNRTSHPSAYMRPPMHQNLNGHSSIIGGSYQSLPVEFNDHSNVFANSVHHQGQNGIFSGLKKWVKGKKEPRSGYNSDASSVTVTSISRQDPDGAPAASSGRKKFDIRSEIIAASRHRNGVVQLDRDSDSQSNRSPSTSVTSKGSNNKRSFTPDSKRTISPDSRKSLSSESCLLTQELPELRQEHRQYKEYRRSSKKLLLPSSRNGTKVSPVTHNYRRDFVLGHISSKGMMMHQYDEGDRHSRNSNESRKSKQSYESPKRCSSADPTIDHRELSRSHGQYSSTKPPIIPMPIAEMHNGIDHYGVRMHKQVLKSYPPPPVNNGSPGRFAQNLITPFNPSKGYRPVAFSPSPGKILSVT